MHNMGQAASLTLPLVHGGRLLGMITCAHLQPRRIPFRRRRAAEILAQQVTLHLDAMTRTRQLTGRLQARDTRNLMAEQMTATLEVASGLLTGAVTLLDLVAADGASVCVRTTTSIPSAARPPTPRRRRCWLR